MLSFASKVGLDVLKTEVSHDQRLLFLGHGHGQAFNLALQLVNLVTVRSDLAFDPIFAVSFE